uniref:C2H2-type domain-containing protein n=1 Tax=Neolamprologus brichardi TaxID=32507 RepID=A0A3Q4M4R1_NEOBR
MSTHREENFPCDICNRVFLSKSSRAEHWKTHSTSSDHPSPSVSRGECDQPASRSESSFVFTSELKYRCGVCSERFRDPEELSEHGCMEAKERPYSCTECNKHFLHASHLKKHRNTHQQLESNRKYSCNQCNSSFASSQLFLTHLKSHIGTVAEIKQELDDEDGEPSHVFNCPVCSQCFPCAMDLFHHFPTHPDGTIEKIKFASGSKLKEHEQYKLTSAAEYECTECKQGFLGEAGFRQHKCSGQPQATKTECSNPSSKKSSPSYFQAAEEDEEEEEVDVTGDDLYNCLVCSMRFTSKNVLLEHQNKEHPNEKPFTCELCGKTFARKRYLKEHERRHRQKAQNETQAAENKFKCSQCESKFTTAQELSLHMRKHAEKDVGEYRCDMCYKSFSQWSLLKQHQESHVGEVVRVTCECGVGFTSPRLLLEHLQKHAQESYTCPTCGETVNSWADYENHEAAGDTQPKTNCGDEEKETNASVGENVIYTKKGGKTLLKCGYCGRTFKFLSQFVIHQRIHTGERPFKCSECGKGFSKNSNLNLHLKTHRKMHAHEEKKVCQYCGKSFPFQSALIRHVRVHTGEKPYKCDICGKAFGQAYFLRVHELTHWSVKRYNCTHCEKSFTHYSNAKNHSCRPLGSDDNAQAHRRPKPSLTYTCHICKNVFDHLQEFNSHMREHTGAKLYRCLYCDKLFGVLSEFNAHRSQCSVEKNASSSAIKEEETVSLIQYTVPALRCSSAHNSALVAAASCETQKKQPQIIHKKRSNNLKKPFQSTVIPAHSLSHLVSKLNKVDNRSDPRRYLCPNCGRLFRHMGRLRAHMLTHAPGQSYTCACCGKTLGSWKKLWHHQRIHRHRDGRFTCPQCGQGFRFVEPYKKHMSEHPEFQWVQVRPKKVFLPYQCERCRCSFKTLDMLFSTKTFLQTVGRLHFHHDLKSCED